MSIYKDCDIRGVYGRELTREDGYKVGRALATMVPGGDFCVGGDVRLSTGEIKGELIKGLVAGGARVCDLGTIATPVMYYALKALGAGAGAMVTASHNPPEYNGVKFMLGSSPVTRTQIDQIKSIIERQAYSEGEGTIFRRDMTGEYLNSLARRFGSGNKGLQVVVDAGNGSMSDIAPQAFNMCGYNVHRLFCEADGRFPNRTPNPAEYDKLGALSEEIIKTGADFGVAFDGDGDRAVFADRKGNIIVSERALVLFIRYLLRDKPTSVVYDQKSSSVVREAALKMGGEPLPERSGHTFIKRRFLEKGAAVAGEVSGHFFFGELGYDDGLFAALMLGEALLYWKKRLSEALSDVICPPITPDLRVFCPYSEQDGLLDAVRAAFSDCPISDMDGVRVQMEDGWLLARKSVTAEQVTVRAEGRDQAALEAILGRIRAAHPRLAAL